MKVLGGHYTVRGVILPSPGTLMDRGSARRDHVHHV
jgi:hypothetical protein